MATNENNGNILLDTVLHPFVDQVGGHTQLMLLDSSTICKPLIQRELFFYLNIPPQLERFVPSYKGVVEVRNTNGYTTLYHPLRGRKFNSKETPASFSRSTEKNENKSSLRESSSQPQLLKVQISSCNDEHLLKDLSPEKHSRSSAASAYSTRPSQRYFILMENVVSKYHIPCMLDLKMGTRQHGDDASDEKKFSQMAKCAASTSSTLGIRLCGMRAYQADIGGFLNRDKYFGRKLDKEGLNNSLRQFFHNGYQLRTNVIDMVIEKLRLLRIAIEQQSSFRFYSSSILITYEGCLGRRGSRARMSIFEADTSMDDDFGLIMRPKRPKKCYRSLILDGMSRKRHSSSSGDDDDSFDNSLEMSNGNQTSKLSFYCDEIGEESNDHDDNIDQPVDDGYFDENASTHVLYKCHRDHAFVKDQRDLSNVDVRLIDFAHTTLSPLRRKENVGDNSLPENGELHQGPDRGFLFGLDNLMRLLVEIRRKGIHEEEIDSGEEIEQSTIRESAADD